MFLLVEYLACTIHPPTGAILVMALESFGKRVQRERKEQGYSQEELADEVGVSRTYLSQIEQGKAQNLSLRLAQKLGTKLGIESPYQEERSSEGDDNIPESLRKFADEDEIPESDLRMLADIEYRGEQPQRVDQWRIVYNVIKNATEGDS
ncbi:helix-turn-helix domain-containing protein [Salinibacter altiplanensis]|uniref:helix-turn-helix domain-containing protein n=1 Tax=Salinibacter altiplanensis TaxID=1803181 RepID=UPI000C9FDE50|nr:helix-turn-helix transcriptional regulator [Salinibacter altiplanensis]